jgi:hypothetical protein
MLDLSMQTLWKITIFNPLKISENLEQNDDLPMLDLDSKDGNFKERNQI